MKTEKLSQKHPRKEKPESSARKVIVVGGIRDDAEHDAEYNAGWEETGRQLEEQGVGTCQSPHPSVSPLAKGPSATFPPRLTPDDQIQALIRSEMYRMDLRTLAAARDRGTEQYADALRDFERRWPFVRIPPISPEDVESEPHAIPQALTPPVIVMRATDPLIWRGSPAGREYLKTSKRVITGARTGMYTRAHPPLGYLDRKDLVHGRLLALRIDLYHSKAEILKRVGEICDLYKNASSGNHAADRRTAKEKKSGSLWERKWKIWDTYVGQGKKDIRRTAELMFPGEFQAQRDKKEMEAEAREKMKDMMRQGEKSPKAMAWYDNRIYRGKAAKSRIEKRDRIVKSLRAIINFCRRAIEIHEGSPS